MGFALVYIGFVVTFRLMARKAYQSIFVVDVGNIILASGNVRWEGPHHSFTRQEQEVTYSILL